MDIPLSLSLFFEERMKRIGGGRKKKRIGCYIYMI